MVRRLAWPVCFAVAFATPEVAFPFNAQVPPVARVGEPYSFTFSSTTFKPNEDNFQYSLTDAPAWLLLDSASRTLSGTPGAGDVGTATPTITATDSTGSTPMGCTLVVVATLGPQLGESILDQLAQMGNRSGPTTLTCLPTTALNFAFSPNTFEWNGAGDLSYYATMSDHTPLPAWLSFNTTQLHFAGTTPPLTTSLESFDILLIASDVVGFAGVWTTFAITVSNHQLYFGQLDSTVNVGANQSCDINNLLGQLILDGNPISENALASASANLPSWMSFDSKNLAITGAAPPSSQQQDINITVTATDEYGDMANTTLHVLFAPALSDSISGQLSASIWPSSAATSSTLGPSSTAPESTNAIVSTSAPSSASTSSATATSTKLASRKSGLIAGSTISVLFLVLVVGFFIWHCKNPRNHLNRAASAFKRTISKPYINDQDDDDVWQGDLEVEDIEDIEKGAADLDRTPEHPPQIVLDVSPVKSSKRNSLSNLFPKTSPKKAGIKRVSEVSALDEEDAARLDNFNRTSWGYRGIDKPHDSMKLANRLVGSSQHGLRHTRQFSSSNFLRRDSYRQSHPTNKRLTGFGHGRPSPGTSRNSFIFSPGQPRITSYAAELVDGASQSTQSTGLLTQVYPPQATCTYGGQRRHPSCSTLTISDSQRYCDPDESPVRRGDTVASTGTQRPIPRRQAHRSTFFAAGGGASRSSRSSSSRARSTLLALATIHGSPDIPQSGAQDLDERHDPLIVKPGDGSSPPPLAVIGPSGSDHLLQRNFSSSNPLARAQTQNSGKSGRTWATTTSGTANSGSLDVPSPPMFMFPEGIAVGNANTHDRLAMAHRRFSARLRARLAGGEGVPGAGSGAVTDVPLSQRSSIIFADPEDEESEAAAGAADPRRQLAREESGLSESLYSQGLDSRAGTPVPNRVLSGIGSGSPTRPAPLRLSASKAMGKGRSGRAVSPSKLGDPTTIPIMDRPRASYRLGGSPERRGLRAPLGILGVGMGNRRVEKSSAASVSRGKGKEKTERRRLMIGREKRPVSVEGVLGKAVGSLKGSIAGERAGSERGNEAFL